MLFWHKKNKPAENEVTEQKVSKVSFEEIESDNQQNPNKIYNENFGKTLDFLEKVGNTDEYLDIVTGDRITAELIDECIEKIDRIYYTINLSIKDYIKELILNHPDMCFIAKNKMTGEVVGYIYMFALTSKCTVNFLLGNTSFETMVEEHFLPNGFKGLFNLNIAMCAFVPDWQNNRTFRTVFVAAVKELARKAENGCYVNYSYLEISNIFERTLAEALGMSIISNSNVLEERKIAGCMFDYKKFVNVPGYEALEKAYTTPEAVEELSQAKDYSKFFEDRTNLD